MSKSFSIIYMVMKKRSNSLEISKTKTKKIYIKKKEYAH